MISVIMSAYNEEEYVENSINSILEQSVSDFELIIVDDNSSDQTPEIIKRFDDSRISFIQNEENIGLPASLNVALEEATGAYVARMDADDISLSNRLEKQVAYLESHPHVHVVGSHTRLIGMNGEFLGVKSYPEGGRNEKQLKNQGPGVAHPSVMMRKSSLERVGNYREPFTYAQDLDLWVRMSRKFGEDFLQIIPEPLLEYRITPDQYNRHVVNDIYEAYAGKYIRCETKLENKIKEELNSRGKTTKSSKAEMKYHYKAGQYLLDRGERKRAGKHFLSAIFDSFLSPHGWYGLVLTCLPKNLRDYVISYIS